MVTTAALIGSAIGSFLNVCIHRLPRGKSLVRRRSHCPKCDQSIRIADKVPVVSWLLLRGRCRACGALVPWSYPVIEASMAIVWATWFAVYGLSPMALHGAVFVSLLLPIAVIDWRHFLIPAELSLAGVGSGLALSLFPGGLTPAESAIGAVVGAGAVLLLSWVGKWWFGEPAVGGGDIKLMAMVGSFVGPTGGLVTIFAGSCIATVTLIPYLLVRGELQRRTRIPFGTFLAMGAVVVLLWW